jgi:hypothetical protein
MPEDKLTAALAKTVAALAPLSPEERRRVVEALHALLEIGAGRRGEEPGGISAPARRPAPRRSARP